MSEIDLVKILKSIKYKFLGGATKETFSQIFPWCDDLFPDISLTFFVKYKFLDISQIWQKAWIS